METDGAAWPWTMLCWLQSTMQLVIKADVITITQPLPSPCHRGGPFTRLFLLLGSPVCPVWLGWVPNGIILPILCTTFDQSAMGPAFLSFYCYWVIWCVLVAEIALASLVGVNTSNLSHLGEQLSIVWAASASLASNDISQTSHFNVWCQARINGRDIEISEFWATWEAKLYHRTDKRISPSPPLLLSLYPPSFPPSIILQAFIDGIHNTQYPGALVPNVWILLAPSSSQTRLVTHLILKPLPCEMLCKHTAREKNKYDQSSNWFPRKMVCSQAPLELNMQQHYWAEL